MLSHAFIISAHKNFSQIKTLIESLSFGDIYLHIDKKSEKLFLELKEHYKFSKNVFLIENRISVNWSGFSQVQATLNLLRGVKKSKKKYDYIHFLSGQDLLLMSQNMLDKYLCSNGLDKLYLEVKPIGSLWWRLKCYSLFRENPKNRKIRYRVIDNLIRLVQLPFIRRHNFDGYELYVGSSWFSITMDCLEYILEVCNETFLDRFKFTACSDEHFFQILLMNSKFKNNVLRFNSRYIIFDGLNASPRVLTMNEKDDFLNGKYIFARKFDSNIDDEVIKYILERNGGK